MLRNSNGHISSKSNPKNVLRSSLYGVVVLALLLSLFGSAVDTSPVLAATTLTVTPITWNVIGLDSNNPAVGPNHFPIGVRVCNPDVASNNPAGTVTAEFKWDDTNETYIFLRPGTSKILSVTDLAKGACTDFYFEVEVKRDSAAYNLTRPYHIEVTDSSTPSTTWSTPVGRELFIEHLVSQSRNSTEFIDYSTDEVTWTRVPAGGTMSLMKGNYYYIKLTGFTATNGYEQIETFINLPNTIFQVISVDTTYTADDSPIVPNPNDKLYGDGCDWENDPLNVNYRSCLGVGKAGGDITVTYYVKIISVPAAPLHNPEPFFSLIYDFSGSSYHYNADYSASMRFFQIVDASIVKSFSPKAIRTDSLPVGTSTLTFTITNPGPLPISDVNFIDNLPDNGGSGQMSIAATGVTYADCGSPLPSSLTVGDTELSFTNISVVAYGTCTISVIVTVPSYLNNGDGTYNNYTSYLKIGDEFTDSQATDTLVASSRPAPPTACDTYSTLARWEMPTGPGTGSPQPNYTAPDVSVATASAGLTAGGSQAITTGGVTTYAWNITDAFSTGIVNPGSGAPYAQFEIDTSNYGGVRITFQSDLETSGNWGSNNNNRIYVFSSDGTGFVDAGNAATTKGSWQPAITVNAAATGASQTWFRINAITRGQAASSTLRLDNIIIEGCARPTTPPTLSKSFNPKTIGQGDASTLTFRFTNPNTVSITNVSFSDTLPTGLVINTPNGVTTPTCSVGTISTPVITAPAGDTTLSLSGAKLTAGASCSFSVSITGKIAGYYHNVSGSISAAGTGPNTTSSGYGVDDLEVVASPVVQKLFGATTILTGGSTTLTFTISNPNHVTVLTGVNFVGDDLLPAGLVISTPNGYVSPTCTSGSMDDETITAPAGGTTISLTGATLSTDAICTFSVNVTGTSIGLKTNTVTIGSANGGTGNTSTATILVKAPAPKISLLKQVSSSPTGPWYNSTTITAGTTAYYRFVVENIGDVLFSNFQVNDPLLGSPISCSPWKRVTDNAVVSPLQLPVAAGLPTPADPAAYCVFSTTAGVGDIDNTATAQGYTTSWLNSNTDTANYKNYNYGHLPADYDNMNLVAEGGAMQLNGNTYFGSTVTSNAYDGFNEPIDPDLYIGKATDDGVTFTPNVSWIVGVNGGSLDITWTCVPVDPATTCYMNAWMDWNRDKDFDDTGERIFSNYELASGTHTATIKINIPAGTIFNETLTPFYSRFRISNQQPDTVSPNGLAVTSDGAPIVGEIEDPFFNSAVGGVITPITVSYFKAEGQGSQVQFNWYTATETGNLGFNLYSADGRVLTRLNDELIPSSVIDSLSQQQYSYTAQTDGELFYIEDVNLFGETRRHGPFALGQEFGSTTEAKAVDWAAIQSELDSANLSNVTGQVNALNMKVNQTGMIRLTYETLRDAGLDLNGVRPAAIMVTNGGRAVPIYATSTNGWFGPGNYIEFYGRGLDTLYTDTNVYTIRRSQTRSPFIATNNALIPTGVKPAAYYLETELVNNQNEYAEYTPGTDPWYDAWISVGKTASSKDFQFELSNLADVDSPATLNLVLWGMSELPLNPDHHIQVRINGTQVADQTFDGVVEQDVDVSIPGGVLQAGENILTLTLPADTGGDWDDVYLDKFSVTYRRQFIAQDGKLTFKAAGQVFRVKNLPSRNVVVYRLVNNRPVRMGHVRVVQAADQTYTATFPGATASYTYLVSAVESLYKPVFSNVPAIPKLNIPAKYLIISHPAFIQGIQPLVQARKAQGYTVNVVNVNHLYAKYTYGVFDPKAIKTYIAYAARNLGTKYVLLVGGDTFDYRNHYGNGSISFIPSLYTQTAPLVKFVPVDPLYADVNGDKVPDLAIGRFPVRTQADLELMIDKTLAYQTKDYGKTALFVSDEMDGETNFKAISVKMSETLLDDWSLENIDLDDMDFDTAQTQLLAGMNRGTALVNFTGHSDPYDWTFAGLFGTAEAEALTNAGRPFVAVQWGCWNNYYVNPFGDGLVQSFLFSGDRGAAATLGAVTLVDSSSEELLGKLLIPLLAKPGTTIGQALRDAKLELALTNPDLLDVLLGWNLMGDPALVIVP